MSAATAAAQPGTAALAGKPSGHPRLFHKVAVFGADDRVPVPPQYQGVHARIGLIFNNQSRKVCTAFCVAADVVATAAHCMFGTSGEAPPRLEDFWFVRAYDKEREYARIAGFSNGSAAHNVVAGSRHLSIRPPIDAASDWALVKISRAACRKGHLTLTPLPPEEVVRAAGEGKVFQISYHRDYANWRAAYSKPCEVGQQFGNVGWQAIARDFSRPDDLLLHRCDTGGASSGSPLLMMTAQGPVVIGINVGTYVQAKVLMRNGQVEHRYKPDTVANTAVSIAAAAEALDSLRGNDAIASGPRLRELQERLKDLRFYAGPVDGGYGAMTRAAIEAFERSRGLPVRGVASESIMRQLSGVTSRPSGERPGGSAADRPQSATEAERERDRSRP